MWSIDDSGQVDSPLSCDRCCSNFSSAYDGGLIPCRINHGGIKNALQWTKEPDSALTTTIKRRFEFDYTTNPIHPDSSLTGLSFDPLLVTCIEGFLETEHPFVFLARTMFRDLMRLEDARDKTLPVLPRAITALRTALMAADEDTFLMALEATRLLSEAVEDEMNAYVPKLAQQIHRKLLSRQLRVPVEDTLATLERNGGKEALAMIRAKIPTYVSIN